MYNVHRSCPTCTWNYSISSMLNVILVWFIFFSWCVITHLRFRGYADRHRNVKIAGHWTKPWRHVIPIKAGLVSYKHNNVAPFVGSRCNKFEHDLCPGPSKSVLSKFLTCYLNITFQSRCRHKQGVNKNTREKQLHSLADTDCWPIGAIHKFALCDFLEFSKTTGKGNLLIHQVPVLLQAQATGEQNHPWKTTPFIGWYWLLTNRGNHNFFQKLVKLGESKNALCSFPEFFENHRKRKPTWTSSSSPAAGTSRGWTKTPVKNNSIHWLTLTVDQ